MTAFDCFTIGLCTAAGGLFLRGIYHSGVLTGWLIRNRPRHEPFVQHLAAPTFDLEAHERRLAEGAPLAFWLDYARVPAKGQIDADKLAQAEEVLRQHGIMAPKTTFRAVMEPPKKRKRPYCGCGEGYIHYEDEHEVEMYRLRKKRLRDHIERTRGPSRPDSLPCGCTGTVHTRAYPSHAGWDRGRYAVCNTCDGTWDYDHDMRKAKKGSKVEWPNGNKLGDYSLDTPLPPAHS